MDLQLDEGFFLAFLCLMDLLITMSSCHRYHSISQNGRPNKTPFRSFTSRFQQQCISICGTSCRCHSFTVEMKGEHEWECHFYDTATMREDLVHTEGVVYNIGIRDCKDLYSVGARTVQVFTKSTGQDARRTMCDATWSWMEAVGLSCNVAINNWSRTSITVGIHSKDSATFTESSGLAMISFAKQQVEARDRTTFQCLAEKITGKLSSRNTDLSTSKTKANCTGYISTSHFQRD